MGERTRRMLHDQTLSESGIKWVDEDYQMKPGDRIIYADSTSAAVTITLPPKAEAIGQFYFIQAPVGATYDVSVNDFELGTEHADGDMDADNDHALFFCTGQAWITIFDGVA